MTGKVAIITGSGTGIGAKLATELNKLGYSVVLTGRNINRLYEVVQQLEYPQNSLCIEADLCNDDQVNKIVEQTVEKFNRIDILVNNAGYRGDVMDIENDDWMKDFLKVLKVNVYAPARLCQLTLPYLEKLEARNGSRGLVLNVSSVASRIAVLLRSYSISKACLTEFTHELARDERYLDSVNFVTVSPGPIVTEDRPYHADHAPLTLLNRSGQMSEVVDLMLFVIAQNNKSSKLMNGCDISIDGGLSCKYHPFNRIIMD